MGSVLTEENWRLFEAITYPDIEYKRKHKVYSEKEGANIDLCKKCGGMCCKFCGCHFSPEDFEDLSFEGLKAEIEKGYISFGIFYPEDWYGDTNVLYLRVRNNNEPIDGGLNSTFKLGRCILLTKKGCKLPFSKRPTGGRNMLPSFKHHRPNCHQDYDSMDCAREWLPYKRVLKQLLDYFPNKDIKCIL